MERDTEYAVPTDAVCVTFSDPIAGKSTLLKAIAKGQVDGFPPQDEVRTFMVADELQSVDADTPIIKYMTDDAKISHHSMETIKETLQSVGFTEEIQNRGVGSLSGGWKMKLALARGILFEADILLLDEPTNHLYGHLLFSNRQ